MVARTSLSFTFIRTLALLFSLKAAPYSTARFHASF